MSPLSKQVTVEAYNPEWPNQFLEIKIKIWPMISSFAISIEHVGSTSVPGLAAKPVIDIDIIIPDKTLLPQAIEKLEMLGYEYRGDQGIKDREAFKATSATYKHHLYVCPKDSEALRNHLLLRDALRSSPILRDEYASLKKNLAEKFSDSIDSYIEGKTEFILEILAKSDLSQDSLNAIRLANKSAK